MKRNNFSIRARLVLYWSAILGGFRAVDEFADEAIAPKEIIDPETQAAPDGLNVKLVWKVGLGVILILWAVVVTIYPLFRYFARERTGGAPPSTVLAYLPPPPPRPRNEHEPVVVLQKFREREQSELNGYQWVDRNDGIVSIPIDRAMQIIAAQGVPPSPKPANPDEYYPPSQASMQTGFEGKVQPETR